MKEEKINIPKRFVAALHFSQLLEFYLENILDSCILTVKQSVKNKYVTYEPRRNSISTAKDYLNRLETFLPKTKYPKLFKLVENAIEKRNDFIHDSFRKVNKDGKGIFLDVDNAYLDPEPNKKMDEWIAAFLEAGQYLANLMMEIQRS